MSQSIYGQVKASEAENREHEDGLSAKRVVKCVYGDLVFIYSEWIAN